MRKVVIISAFLSMLSLPGSAPASTASACIGINLNCVPAQYVRTVQLQATAITWSDADDITWGDGTIIVEN